MLGTTIHGFLVFRVYFLLWSCRRMPVSEANRIDRRFIDAVRLAHLHPTQNQLLRIRGENVFLNLVSAWLHYASKVRGVASLGC
uniref:Uncharacterized protein n=1 Tax=Candidatus Kentrum sp. TUN TaxID=2126343 RepID=A0A450ZUZ2_9GAMM|nr:MAG: hypothetical protein BECKTUN1418F_GA0071002_11227 [Candidatus Kentron sp. TUN]VFK65838.1 MAG: hypothetical protein BECKTUN1418E_GA0071001_11146 [Candidatus Kentron sp. TUN]